MTEVEGGGDTVFPRAGGLGEPQDLAACDGLRVRPEKGKVLVWYNLHANGNLDPASLHGGCAVRAGTKWAANKWLWNKPSGFYGS
jgi:prolyl 4-hydroxylase